jgi:transcription antitermination factor NusG
MKTGRAAFSGSSRTSRAAFAGSSRTGRAAFADTGIVRYPAALIDRPHWYALRTRARQEKRTHSCLDAAGIESLGAVADVERVWADRTREVGMPLFPGYIFVRIELSRVGEVLRWPGAVDLVRTRGVPSPVREDEMAAVIHLARGVGISGQAASDVDFFARGARVRVERGPFEGMVGDFLERRGGSRVAIRLDALRQAKAVEINPRCLAPMARSG